MLYVRMSGSRVLSVDDMLAIIRDWVSSGDAIKEAFSQRDICAPLL